ncbi:MAG: ABC transporter ATP-binding protein [Coriobacteriaceae bacterium]|nr:ABC transporter ATP-binding protein [Coriobacteriaceae bacterium]
MAEDRMRADCAMDEEGVAGGGAVGEGDVAAVGGAAGEHDAVPAGSAPAATPTVPAPAVPAWRTAVNLWRAAAGIRWRLVVALVASLLYVGFSLSAPAYSAHIIDLLWENIQRSFADGTPFAVTLENGGREILIYLGIWTLAWGFYSVQVMVMASFAEQLNLLLRRRIAAKLGALPLSYYDAHQPGDTISRATNDLDKVSEVLQRGLLQLIIAATMLVGALIMMARYSLALTGVFAVCVVGAFVVTKILAGRTLKISDARQAAVGELTVRVEEAYSGRAVIKAFGRERASLEAMRDAADELARTSSIADFITTSAAPAVRFLVRISLVVIGVMAGGMLIAGQITVGVFQAFFQYVNQGSEPLTQLSMTCNMLQGALAAAARVFALLDEGEVVPDPTEPAHLPVGSAGRVTFEHVRFGYDADRPLMRDVSLVAEPGQKVAIVGATGAGKTTLINLLMRFYEIDGGRIALDGVSTRDLTRADLRRRFGMVLQDAWLFEGTIAENIAYGRPESTREEIEAAARAARVDFFVRTLPDGYDTMLSNEAESISQGQRQLLTIARAMLSDPAILILDEATSSVDTRTEQAIVEAMETLVHGRTSFVIAHRLSTIVDADLILVMEAGTIVEQGTHEELLAAGGPYAELYRSQFA